uniref:Uncharacterized protein n=1 Tax=Amazona collaria TaxID=241587 RepID=A0A8B9J0R9_9PSIT
MWGPAAPLWALLCLGLPAAAGRPVGLDRVRVDARNLIRTLSTRLQRLQVSGGAPTGTPVRQWEGGAPGWSMGAPRMDEGRCRVPGGALRHGLGVLMGGMLDRGPLGVHLMGDVCALTGGPRGRVPMAERVTGCSEAE